MKTPNKLFLALSLIITLVAVVMLVKALLSGVTRDVQNSALGLVVWLGIASLFIKSVRASRREHDAFVALFKELDWEDALRCAEESCRRLAHGLVEAKVLLPADTWSAFERKGFHFALVRDSHGKAKVLTL